MRSLLVTCALWASLLTATGAAQSVSGHVAMTSDRSEVGVGELFRLQIRADINGADIERFAPPDLSAFEIRGRQVSRPVQFRFGFGGQQQILQSTTVHTYTLLARAPGRYELPPAEVVAGGQSFRSNPLTIVVGGSAQPPPTTPPTTTPPTTTPDPQTAADPEPLTRVEVDGVQVDPRAFLRTVADEAEPYVGQQVTVSVYLYTREPIRAAPQVTREPTADGFWVHDLLPPQRTLEGRTQRIQGVYYHVYLLRRFAAFPLREGELTIGAPEVILQGSVFDFFGGGRPSELRRTGVPITIRARPLPNPPPHAVVGRYTIDAQLDRTQARTGDAVTLTVVVEGTGNVRDVNFELPPIDGLQVLPPTTEDRVEQARDRVGGSRRIQWLLIPQRPGTFTLPALSLSAFDPETERYTLVRGPSLTLTAVGNALDTPDTPSADEDAGVEATEAPTPNEPSFSFGPIRTRAELRRATPPVSSRGWYWLAVVGMPLLALVVASLRRRARRRRAAPKRQKPKRRLAQAAAHAKDGEPRAFYAAIAAALQDSLEEKLGESVRGLTRDALRRTLQERGMDAALADRLLEELEICDFARFSSSGGSADEMAQTLERARTLLADLDDFTATEGS